MFFWIEHRQVFGTLFEHYREMALFVPSSAVAERVFSMYKHLFNETQANALEDVRELSIKLRFNENQRSKLEGRR